MLVCCVTVMCVGYVYHVCIFVSLFVTYYALLPPFGRCNAGFAITSIVRNVNTYVVAAVNM